MFCCFLVVQPKSNIKSTSNIDANPIFIFNQNAKSVNLTLHRSLVPAGLLLFLVVIFSASLSENYDFVPFDSLDGSGALFANVLCDIPVLRIS